MKRAAWIILGGVVYLLAMSALGRIIRAGGDDVHPNASRRIPTDDGTWLEPIYR